MVTFSLKSLINKPLEAVYCVADKYPEFVDFYSKRLILNSDEFFSEVEIESVFFGFKFRWKGKGIKVRNSKIEWVQSEGLLKGMKAKWFFEGSSQGTEVSMNVSYGSSIPFWDQIAMNVFIKRTVPKILHCLKHACEST